MEYKEKIVNLKTGEETWRLLTAEELAQHEADAAQAAADRLAREEEAQAKAAAKTSAQAKLATLGLTADEVAALLG